MVTRISAIIFIALLSLNIIACNYKSETVSAYKWTEFGPDAECVQIRYGDDTIPISEGIYCKVNVVGLD